MPYNPLLLLSSNLNSSVGSFSPEFPLNGTANQINAILKTLVFTPFPEYVGQFSIHFTLSETFQTYEWNVIFHAIPINDVPKLVNAQFSIYEGQSLTISSDNFLAVDADSTTSFIFILQDIRHVDLIVGNASTDRFTSSELDAGIVQLVHDGSDVAPSFQVVVSDGIAQSLPENVYCDFTGVNDAPFIVTNYLNISNGEEFIITLENIRAIDSDSLDSDLVLLFDNIQNCKFYNGDSLIKNGRTISQSLVSSGVVKIVHDGKFKAPNYSVTPGDGFLWGAPSFPSIFFNSAVSSFTFLFSLF